jgi:hypothetical protein
MASEVINASASVNASANALISYFDKVPKHDPPKIYSNHHQILVKVNGKYSMRKNSLVDIAIQGDLTGIYSIVSTYFIVTTNVNTYCIVSNSGTVVTLGIITTKVELTKSSILLITDNAVRFFRLGASVDSICLAPADSMIVANRLMIDDSFHKYKYKYVNSFGESVSISKEFIPTDIYFIKNKSHIVMVDGLPYVYLEDADMVPISMSFKIKSIFLDNCPVTAHTTHNIYVLDDQDWVWTLDSSLQFVKIFQVAIPFNSQIKQILYCVNSYFVFGRTFIHAYDVASCSSSPMIIPTATMYFEQDGVILLSAINNIIVLLCLATNKEARKHILLSTTQTELTAVTVNPYSQFTLKNFSSYAITAKPNTSVFYWSTYFCIQYPNGKVITTGGAKVIEGYLDKVNHPSFSADVEMHVEANFNTFNQFFNTLVCTNFKSKLSVVLVVKSSKTAGGRGVIRDIHNRVLDYVEHSLLTQGAPNDHVFWQNLHNCYYFGKLIGYISQVQFELPFHFNLSTLLIIYEKMQRLRDPDVDFDIMARLDQLAPFHDMMNPSEFKSFKNLSLEYKVHASQFKQLALPYDTFADMIYDKLKLTIGQTGSKELIQAETIAIGLYQYNKSFSNISLYELTRYLSGDFKYDRQAVLDNICISTYGDLSDEDSYKDKMRSFINGLDDDELKQLMVSITGYIKRPCPVHIVICNEMYIRDDFYVEIATCSDKMNINQLALDTPDYAIILKAYLCQTDRLMEG